VPKSPPDLTLVGFFILDIGFVMVYLLTFLVTTLYGYIIHYVMHQPWAGRFYKSHMAHHEELYRSWHFYSDEYRSPGKDNTVYLFIPTALLMLALPVYFHLWFVVIEMLFIGWLSNYIHDQTHLLKNKDKQWIKKLTHLHIVHHEQHDMNKTKNLGIFFFLWDRVFRTYIR
jgi:sterol desaturase/sphingolipid hydroxylase (fatty acid hydroxylase superfamily)